MIINASNPTTSFKMTYSSCKHLGKAKISQNNQRFNDVNNPSVFHSNTYTGCLEKLNLQEGNQNARSILLNVLEQILLFAQRKKHSGIRLLNNIFFSLSLLLLPSFSVSLQSSFLLQQWKGLQIA